MVNLHGNWSANSLPLRYFSNYGPCMMLVELGRPCEVHLPLELPIYNGNFYLPSWVVFFYS
jgi:hypothetical protein